MSDVRCQEKTEVGKDRGSEVGDQMSEVRGLMKVGHIQEELRHELARI
jgi:hypothetical protein